MGSVKPIWPLGKCAGYLISVTVTPLALNKPELILKLALRVQHSQNYEPRRNGEPKAY